MSSWCYGLVREKEGLRVNEVYWKKNKPFMRCPVFRENKSLLHWWDVIRDIPIIVYDLFLQKRYYHIIEESEFNPK